MFALDQYASSPDLSGYRYCQGALLHISFADDLVYECTNNNSMHLYRYILIYIQMIAGPSRSYDQMFYGHQSIEITGIVDVHHIRKIIQLFTTCTSKCMRLHNALQMQLDGALRTAS